MSIVRYNVLIYNKINGVNGQLVLNILGHSKRSH